MGLEDHKVNSMFYWYPKIRDLPIPQPKTEMLKIPKASELFRSVCDGDWSYFEPFKEKVIATADKIGYPLFVRTDQASGKHGWDETCFVEKAEDLLSHIGGVIEFNELAGIFGLPYTGFAFREYIPMDSGFTAFNGNLPINPERRYFVKDGEVICHHAYWIEEVIRSPSIPNWKAVLKRMNRQTAEEVNRLGRYARLVSEQIVGAWSVDFCKAKDGEWYLIDMALAEDSWHPKCDSPLAKNNGGLI